MRKFEDPSGFDLYNGLRKSLSGRVVSNLTRNFIAKD